MTRLSSRIAIFLKSQNPAFDRAENSASQSVAALALAAKIARWTCPRKIALQLITEEEWGPLRNRLRQEMLGKVIVSVDGRELRVYQPIAKQRRVPIPETHDSNMDHPWSWQP